MKSYKYKIDPFYLKQIKNGKKEIEFRKYDRKYLDVNIGDILILISTADKNSYVIVKVIKKNSFFPKDYTKEYVEEALLNDISWDFWVEYYDTEIMFDKIAGAFKIELVSTYE